MKRTAKISPIMKNENYFVIQGWMVNELQLKGNDLLIFAIIYGFSQNGESKFFGSLRYLQESIGCSEPTVRKALNSLIDQGLIIKHQRITNNVTFNEYSITKNSLVPLKNLWVPPKDRLGNNIEDKEISSILENSNGIHPIVISQFNKFWKIYPSTRRGSKGKAFTSWSKICKKPTKDRPKWSEIRNAIRDQMNSDQWQEEGFIPLASTWLNNSRWLDDPGSLKNFRKEIEREKEITQEPKDATWMK